jgi:sterol desaturase/sphingolipid hydroxylase (fatty acid hydroxylase superfamily)
MRLRQLYLPSVLYAMVAGWLMWHGLQALEHDGTLGATIASGRNELVGPAFVGLVLVVVVCEQLWPAERRSALARGHVQDACFFVLYAALVVPLVTVIGVGIAALLVGHASWIVIDQTAAWPRWVLVIVTLIAMDACNWLAHSSEHRFRPLWRMHAIHHTQEELTVLTSFRAHPLVHTAGFILATVPVIMMTADHPMAPMLITVYLCLGTVPHANVPWSFGLFGRIIVSPAYHRLHHAMEGPQNVNLGIVLTVWDVLAHRAVFPALGAPACRTGLAGRPIVVEQEGLRHRPVSVLLAQFIEPFTVVKPSPVAATGSADASRLHTSPT